MIVVIEGSCRDELNLNQQPRRHDVPMFRPQCGYNISMSNVETFSLVMSRGLQLCIWWLNYEPKSTRSMKAICEFSHGCMSSIMFLHMVSGLDLCVHYLDHEDNRNLT